MTGRPTLYSDGLAEQICELIATGSNLTKIARMDDMPCEWTLRRWAFDHPQFSQMYARAREYRAGFRSDKIDEYVDDAVAGRLDAQVARVAIDAQKWLASKEQPRVFGDKLTTEHTGKDGGPIETKEVSDTEAARRVAYMLGQAIKRNASVSG